MALSEATLAAAFAALTPRGDATAAAQALVDAFGTYAAGATAASALLAGGVALGKAAMLPALAGMNASGGGAAAIAAAVHAFWTAVAGGLATSFAGATAISPPFAGLTADDLQDAFDANTSGEASLEDAAAALAAAVHAKRTGGTVTTPGPTVTPII